MKAKRKPRSKARRIVLLEERRGDTWYITGVNIKGLWLWGKDREKLWAEIPIIVDALLRLNAKLPGGPSGPSG